MADLDDLRDALDNLAASALGIAMPVMSPSWYAGTTPSYDAQNLALTLESGWLAPLAAVATPVAPAGGDSRESQAAHEPMPVTLLDASGTPIQGPGLLLTVTPQLYLRLRRLYARVIEEPASTEEPAVSFPVRPVPRYFFYAGESTSERKGLFRAQDALNRGGRLTIHDTDGMPIDPLAVAGAFAAILRAHHLLEHRAGPLGSGYVTPRQLLDIAALGGGTAVHVRLSDFAGRPYDGTHLRNLSAVSGGASGVFSASAGATLSKEEATDADGAFPPQKRDRLLIGPATTGTLGDEYTLPALRASTEDMPRDFFSLRVVELGPYLIGARSSTWIATQLEPAPAVRIRESLTLLGDGNQVLGATRRALEGAEERMCVAEAISDDFPLPPSPDPAECHWPAFPPGGSEDPEELLPVDRTQLSSTPFAATAQYLEEDGQTYGDVVVTLTGLPPHAAVRIYNRRFLPDAREGRGDGAGGVASATGELTLRLVDPFALQTVRPPQRRPVTVPNPGTLHFDMMVVRHNTRRRNARLYGNVVIEIPSSERTSTPPPAPSPNGLHDSGVRRAVCNAGILGLGVERDWSALFGSDPGGAARALLGEGNPRDQSRLPLMARREILVAGRVDESWRACLSAGRLTREAHSADPRRGAPGGMGGRETQLVGVATEGGRLAYDLARMALRRTLNVLERLDPLGRATYAEPSAPTTGRFAAAALQTVAPFCETPELGLLRPWLAGLSPSERPRTLADLLRVLGERIGGIPSGELSGLWNSLRSAVSGHAEANRIYDELWRELVASCFGRRDTQWALQDAIGRARRFIYIETPGFAATQGGSAEPYSGDLVSALSSRLAAVPGLHVIVCVPRHPDVATAQSPEVATGFELFAAYELQNRFQLLKGLQTAGNTDEMKSRVVAFHPIGFPGRPSRLEGTVVIVDDVWALAGASSFRRRGLTFDGSTDVVFTDTVLEEGRSPVIRDFRRRLLAMRLGAPERTGEDTRSPMYARLLDGVDAFYAIKEKLIGGGGGTIERLWSGDRPGITPPASEQMAMLQDLANPEGQHFDGNLGTILGTHLTAALAGATYPYP